MGEYNYITTKEIMLANEIRKEYKDSLLVKTYDQILENNAELIQKLSNDKYFDTYFAIYYYLLHNGYFSKDNNFIYSTPQIKEITTLLGINIYDGHGVCRNISAHFVDIMSKIRPREKLFLIGTYLEKRNNRLNRSKFITENIEYKNYISSSDRKKYRHLEVMKIERETPIIYDPTNFYIQLLVENEHHKNSPLDLSCDLFFRRQSVSNERITLERELSIEASKDITQFERVPADKEYLYEIRQKAINSCLSQKSLIEEHYQENEHLYKCLTKELVRKR